MHFLVLLLPWWLEGLRDAGDRYGAADLLSCIQLDFDGRGNVYDFTAAGMKRTHFEFQITLLSVKFNSY